MNVYNIQPFIILKIYIKRLDGLSVLSIFVLHVIVEGIWVKAVKAVHESVTGLSIPPANFKAAKRRSVFRLVRSSTPTNFRYGEQDDSNINQCSSVHILSGCDLCIVTLLWLAVVQCQR